MTVSVVLFGIDFLCNDRYGKASGSGTGQTVWFLLISNSAGLLVLLSVNRFRLGFTPFTLIAAAVAAFNGIIYTFCSLKALTRINLSLYSVFAMLGGMTLPFLVGLIFYKEPMTAGKGVCVFLIAVALFLTVDSSKKSGGAMYYAGVFISNGMSGVLTKLFVELPFEKTSSADYSIWIAVVTLAFALICLPFVRGNDNRPGMKAALWSAGFGVTGRVANYWLVIALAVLPASVQYPFVTGGTMIVSTLLGYIIGQRPSRRELFAVVISFIGVLLLAICETLPERIT